MAEPCGAKVRRCVECDTTVGRRFDRCPLCDGEAVESTCRRSVGAGGRCQSHGGHSPQVLARRENDETEAQVERQLGALLVAKGRQVQEHPLDGLLAEVDRSSMVVTALGELVGDLETVAMRNGQGNAVPHVVLDLWNREREFHAKVCKMALDAGVDERRLRLVESQVERLFTAVTGALRELELDDEQQARFRSSLANRLRSLAA